MTETERTIGTPEPASDEASDVPEKSDARADAEANAPATEPGSPKARVPLDPEATAPEGRTDEDAEQKAEQGAAVADEESPAADDAPAGRGRRRIAVLIGVAAFAYALDLITKIIVVAKLEHHPPVDVIGDVLRFQAVRNAGAAFGIGEALTIVFTVIASAVIVVIARIARKLYSTPWAVALGMLLGGALGNLTDRVFRSPGLFEGHVVDFIAPRHFAVFNLADSAIVCGGILIVILSFRGIDPDGTLHRD